MATQRERRKWALEMSAALLRTEDIPTLEDFDQEESEKRKAFILEVADMLEGKARKIKLNTPKGK